MYAHKVSSKQRIAAVTMRLFFGGLLMSAVMASAETPDTFRWAGGANGVWNSSGVWTPVATARTAPGIAGDLVAITNGVTIAMTNHFTVSGISVSAGSLSLSTTGVITQTFESASAAVTNKIYASAVNVYLGDNPVDNDLTLKIVENLLFSGNHNNGYVSMFVRGQLIGGTVETPVAFLTEVNNNQYSHFRVHLMNTNNLFCGDIYVGAGGAASQGDLNVFLGYGSTKGTDGMLGNTTNRVILRNKVTSLCMTGGDSAGLKRRVLGTGSIKGSRVDTGYANLTYADPLVLGDGSSLEPSIELTNAIGKINVNSSTLTTHTNSQFRINVTATTNDQVSLSTTTAFVYTGRVLMEPLTNTITPGTSWNIITVTSASKGFTFSPSYTTPFYSFKTTGNATAGWVVTATKQVDTTLYPAVQNLETTLISETNATINADVISVAPDSEATLRAYCGTVDQGANFGAWQQVFEYPSKITDTGSYSLKLNTLANNTTYYVRHSISNSTGMSMSSDVVSFTTRPWTTPDIFTWVATNADWSTLGVWTINTPYQRRIPEFQGDKIIINMLSTYNSPAGVSRTVNLTNDVTISSMTINDGYSLTTAITATNGPAKLTFDADTTGTNYLSATGQLAGLRLGNDVGDPSLTVEIKQPLVFQKNTAYDLDFSIYSPILGGSEVSPTPIFFNAIGDQYCRLYASILNTNNTFRGDLYIGAGQVFEASSMLTVGNASRTARNEMLGDPANQVFLRNNSTLRYYAPTNLPAVVNRQIRGNGTLSSTKALYLASDAVVDPRNISGSGLGTININATALTADSSAQYALNVTPTNNVCDKLVVTVSSPLVLTGTLKLEPTSVAKISVGTSWPVISVATNATAFTCALKKSSGYILTTSGNATTGWTVTATAAPLNTILIVR